MENGNASYVVQGSNNRAIESHEDKNIRAAFVEQSP